MFTDQIGSTANSERRTPKEKRQVSEEQSALTAEAAGRCRGVIVADTGDGHMLTFNACSDAVLCGYLIQQSVRERNAALTHPNLKFDLHIGIEFGHFVPLPDGNSRSDASNRAARICSLCPAGEIYFTEKVARELHPQEVGIVKVDDFTLKGVSEAVSVYRLLTWSGEIPHASNPFVWRGPITDANAFFDRDREQRQLKDCLLQHQNCQIVGERRMGKTSLLLQIARTAPTWRAGTLVAVMDMQNPICFTLSGFLRHAARQFDWSSVPTTLTEFAEQVETLCKQNIHLIMCIDEFEEFTLRRDEFTRDFFLTLRACNGMGMSVITTSRQPLSTLTDPHDPTSPFYNIFHLFPLSVFTPEDSADFLILFRPGISAFMPQEQDRIQEFTHNHPMALQIACYHVIEANRNGASLSSAIQQATVEIRALLPNWDGQLS